MTYEPPAVWTVALVREFGKRRYYTVPGTKPARTVWCCLLASHRTSPHLISSHIALLANIPNAVVPQIEWSKCGSRNGLSHEFRSSDVHLLSLLDSRVRERFGVFFPLQGKQAFMPGHQLRTRGGMLPGLAMTLLVAKEPPGSPRRYCHSCTALYISFVIVPPR